ncbi:MAG: hypothetical protein L3J28_04015 [Candidatus Polarisedimenticolaceae bacterium]|nr:hypothetical protein [Candidatus Polarisedimenticolaceae bacterium]
MEQIEQLFRHFMREQEILGRDPAILKGYCDSFRWFRKLMPDVAISNFNSEKIIEFTIRLYNFRYWSHSINDFISFNASTILNFMNYLWSFFIWLKEEQNISGLIEKSENQRSKTTMKKLLFLSLYRRKSKSLNCYTTGQKSKDCYLANDLLILQLSRRYNSFFTLSDTVFFIGIADYVKFIFRKRQLTDIIKHHILEKEKHDFETSEKLDEIWQNSVWGSWFDLELVYLIIYKMREVIHDFSDDLDVKYYLKSCYKEMKNIIDNSTDIEPHNFKRTAYNVDIIRVHNFILETLEIDNEIQESKMKRKDKILYKFNLINIENRYERHTTDHH